jgi:hypothetical protein
VYDAQDKELVQLKGEARLKGGFYASPKAKLLFVVRINRRIALGMAGTANQPSPRSVPAIMVPSPPISLTTVKNQIR